jgi:hypothetical protein
MRNLAGHLLRWFKKKKFEQNEKGGHNGRRGQKHMQRLDQQKKQKKTPDSNSYQRLKIRHKFVTPPDRRCRRHHRRGQAFDTAAP